MTKFHLFSQDSVRLDEFSEFNSVIFIFPRPGRCGFLTAPDMVIKLPKYLLKLHETAPTGECVSPMLISREVCDATKPSHFRMSILRVAEKSPA